MKKVISNFSGCGIYLITSPTNRVYIGQSWNLHDRFLDYRRKGCKKQIKLSASLDKYGFNAHKFEVILQLSDSTNQSIMDYWEIFFISHFKSEGYKLMNIREGGSRGKLSRETIEKLIKINTGRKDSEATLIRKREAFKGSKNPRFGVMGADNSISKPINQYSTTGEFIKTWPAVACVTREMNIDNGSISKCCKGIRKTAGNYVWRYVV